MQKKPTRYAGWSLIAAFLGIVVSFMSATVVIQRGTNSVDAALEAIALDAAPSMERLVDLRAETRRVELVLDDYIALRARSAPAKRVDVDGAIARLDSSISEYLALPASPDEVAFGRTLQEDAKDLAVSVRSALDAADAGRIAEARSILERRVEPTSDALMHRALGEMKENADKSVRMSADVKEAHRRSARLGYVLDVVCAVMAIIALLVVLSHLQRHTRLTEEQLRLESDRATELEAFAGRVAHDLANPLSAARLAIQMEQRRAHEAGDKEVCERALRSLDRAHVIMRGLLDFARAGARPDPGERAELLETVGGVVAELTPATDLERIRLELDPMPDDAVACSAGVLASIVSNLVRNAIKYMGDRPTKRIRVRVEQKGDRFRLEVRDTGPGLPPALAAHAFDPYVRAKGTGQPGIGLGLAIVKRLAEGHGGSVGVLTEVGVGSTFWVELPRAHPREHLGMGDGAPLPKGPLPKPPRLVEAPRSH